MQDNIIIGLVGSFGSGCTKIAKDFIEQMGYKYLSLGDILKRLYKEENQTNNGHLPRSILQDYGDNIRSKYGAGYLADIAIKEIQENKSNIKWIVDSFRNPEEMAVFRRSYNKCYFLGIYADYKVRWNRIKDKYNDDEREFQKDDIRDSGEDIPYGQHVRDCFMGADIIITNNKDYYEGNDDFLLLQNKIKKYISLVEKPFSQLPTEKEAIMAIAYANSFRSNCLKRRVGAVIVDEIGNLFSSGYNEVPRLERNCRQKYGRCYRDYLKDEISKEIERVEPDLEKQKQIKTSILKRFKNLDYCKSLHAEENAILNVARLGSSLALKGATLYTTTYPCNLCANKIAQVGISKLIYFEPYPMMEAKEILDGSGVNQEAFEGVTFLGYFKLFGSDIK